MNISKKINHKAFTLIELLAVIVILAIIVIIAISALGDNVEKTSKKTLTINANKYVAAVNDLATLSIKEDVKYDTGTYDISSLPQDRIKLSGTKPDSGYVVFDDFEVVSACLKYDTFAVIYTGTEDATVVEDHECVPGEEIATENPYITYNYNIGNYTFPTNSSFMNIGYIPNFDKDFKIEITASLPKNAVRYLLVGNYNKSNNFNLEINASNKLKVYQQSERSVSTDSVIFGYSLDYVFTWDATNKAYTFTASNGSNIVASTSGTISGLSGLSGDSLRAGQDYRGGSTFFPYTLKSIKITEPYSSGDPLTNIPSGLTRDGYTFSGWYTESTGGTEVTSSTLVGRSDVTYYARWTNN